MADPSARVTPVRAVLAASLALNLFLMGFVGAQAWRRLHPGPSLDATVFTRPGSGAIAQGYFRQLIRSLPAEDGRVLRSAFAARMPEILTLGARSLSDLERVRQAIGTTPFDPEQVKSDIATARQTRERLRTVIADALIAALPNMSQPGREALSRYRLRPAQ